MPLTSLRTLRDEMIARDWVIACFPFTYAKNRYFVLVKRYIGTPPKMALVELCFSDRADLDRTLCAPANSAMIDTDAKTLREYFGIQWAPNLGDLLRQFTQELGHAIPDHLPTNLPDVENRAILHHLNRSDAQDPTKLYCIGVRRNASRPDGTPGQRTAYNTQKTRMLRPALYEKLGGDPGLSFCYSSDPADQLDDNTILERLSHRQGHDDRR